MFVQVSGLDWACRSFANTCLMCVQVTGLDGAHNLAETLKSRGVTELEFVSDEGLTVVQNLVPGMTKPVALYVGIEMLVFVFLFHHPVYWAEVLFALFLME